MQGNIKIIRVKAGIAPKLKKQGIEFVVWENFTEGSSWKTTPHTRYFMLKNGKQIDGFDVESKKFNKKEIIHLLERSKHKISDIKSNNIRVFIK